MARPMWVYIMTNKRNTTLYTGVTNDLCRRVCQHRAGAGSAFTRKYNIRKLVYYEAYDGPHNAIEREKQIKGGSHARKVALIEAVNPEWRDLFDAETGDIAALGEPW